VQRRVTTKGLPWIHDCSALGAYSTATNIAAPHDQRTQQDDIKRRKQLGRSTHYNNKQKSIYLELGVQLGAANGPGRRLIPVILHVT
jgi:hypothetical protein